MLGVWDVTINNIFGSLSRLVEVNSTGIPDGSQQYSPLKAEPMRTGGKEVGPKKWVKIYWELGR